MELLLPIGIPPFLSELLRFLERAWEVTRQILRF